MNTNWPKLLYGIKRFKQLDEESLRDVDCVADVIRRIGLAHDERGLYGDDVRFMNWQSEGLWQIPMQLARCLVALSRERIDTFLEVGSFSGWTVTVMTAYLLRFNPRLQAETIDMMPGAFSLHDKVAQCLPVTFHAETTSDALAGRAYDLVLIDANHSYEWVMRDYSNVGVHSAHALFHDINDTIVRRGHPVDGGVPRFWNALRQAESRTAVFSEFLDHPSGDAVMGLGLRQRRT